MSEKLKRCPLCGSEALRSSPGTIDVAWCSSITCEMNGHSLTVRNWNRIPRPTPPDEVARVVREMKVQSTQPGTHSRLIAKWAARLSRYTPAETEEVRLLRELRKAAGKIPVNLGVSLGQYWDDIIDALGELAELEGQDE
jgi:hypothetical protein